jgi:deoxycytidylate deaminase
MDREFSVSTRKKEIASNMKIVAGKSLLHSKHCSALIQSGKVLNVSINSSRTKFDKAILPCAHSEMACLHRWWCQNRGTKEKKRRRLLKKMTLIIVRVMASGEFGNSMPCKDCLDLIKDLGIKRVLYSNQEGKLVEKKTLDMIADHESGGYSQVGEFCRSVAFCKH